MEKFEKYIANDKSVWGKRPHNQGGRELKPQEIAQMLNELESFKSKGESFEIAARSCGQLLLETQSERNAAIAMLRGLEWLIDDDTDSEFCPSCWAWKDDGHLKVCELSKIINSAK